MSCLVNIFTDVLQNESAGGTIVFDFYSTTADGTADSGGSAIEVGANGEVDFNAAVAGFYYFTYTVGEGDCETSLQFFIRVTDRPDAGIGDSITVCEGDPIINLFSLLTGTPQLTGEWSGNGTSNVGYDDVISNDPTDDTFNPATSGVGVFSFIYTVAVNVPSGYTVSNCPNCNSASTVITINVIDCSAPCGDVGTSSLNHVCRTAACTFNLFSRLGGTPDTGGQWVLLSGSPQIITITGGHLGTVNFTNAAVGTYQFQYSFVNIDPDCTNTAIVTIIVVQEPNAGNNITLNLCESMPNTNIFPFITGNPTSGGVFSISPALPNGTFNSNGVINPAVGDAGTYTVTYTVTTATPNNPCGTTCSDVSTHTINIHTDCNAGTNGSGTVCQGNTFTLNAATLLGGVAGGTWFVFGQSVNCTNVYTSAVFSVNGGAQQNQQGNTLANLSVLSNFASLGCISFIYRCEGSHPTCFDTATYILQVVNCPPACNAAVTISTVGCNMSSIITGTCTNPIYQWQRLINSVWTDVAGANASTLTGVNGGTYRLRVTNCNNCNALFSNQLTLSCPPPPTCNITCSLVYNTALQRFEGTITNSGAAGGSMNYQFNKYNTNTPLCTNCTGVAIATCSGTVVIPAMGSVTIFCNSAQTSIEECWRLVLTGSACNSTLCCVKKPATAALENFYVPSLPQFTTITGVTVNIGGSNIVWDKTNFPAHFNCFDYESTHATGIVNGTNNCALAQLVNDINQRLTALYAGDAVLIQSSKSSSIRINQTDIIFVNLLTTGSPIPFTTTADTGCDPIGSWHFQEVTTTNNLGVTLDASAGGTFNLFTSLLQLYMPEIPSTGTFTKATGTTSLSGCVDINTTCLASVGATVTIQNGGGNHGLLSWSSFTPLISPCHFHVRYVFNMPDTGCQECMLISVIFVT